MKVTKSGSYTGDQLVAAIRKFSHAVVQGKPDSTMIRGEFGAGDGKINVKEWTEVISVTGKGKCLIPTKYGESYVTPTEKSEILLRAEVEVPETIDLGEFTLRSFAKNG